MLVGVGQDTGAARVSDYLQNFNIPIRSVAFEVLSVGGQLVLLREEDPDGPASQSSSTANKSVEEILAQFSDGESRTRAIRFLEIAERHGLVPRPYKRTVMIAPPQNKGRFLMLITVANGQPWILAEAEPFIEFFGFDEIQAHQQLDRFRKSEGGGEVPLTQELLEELDRSLSALFGTLEEVETLDV